MTKQRVFGAALAAAVATSVVAPVADGAMPAVCSNEREVQTNATIWDPRDGWAINVYPEIPVAGQFNALKIAVWDTSRTGDDRGAFPQAGTYRVRTNATDEYVDAPGYGGVDADGNPTLLVFLPETYDTDSPGTLQIKLEDPDHALPASGTTGTRALATLYTAAAAQASIKTLDEFGDPAQRIPASVKADGFTIPASRHSADGTVHFDHVLPCTAATVEFGIPRYSKYLALAPVSSDGLSPSMTTDLGTHNIRFERGDFTASILDTDGRPVAGQPVRVEGPGGSQTLTTNEAGRFTLTEAQPGAYTLSAESNGSTLRKTLFVKPGESRSVSVSFAAAPATGTQVTATATVTAGARTTVTPAPVTVQSMATITETVLSTTTTSRTVPAAVHTGEPVTVTSTANVAVTSTAPRPVVTRTASAATTTENVVVDPNGRVVLTALAVVATLGGAVAAVLGSIPGLDVQQLAARIEGGK